jgi:hypothetical protein
MDEPQGLLAKRKRRASGRTLVGLPALLPQQVRQKLALLLGRQLLWKIAHPGHSFL